MPLGDIPSCVRRDLVEALRRTFTRIAAPPAPLADPAAVCVTCFVSQEWRRPDWAHRKGEVNGAFMRKSGSRHLADCLRAPQIVTAPKS
jgi:hypothetical protein